MHRIIIKEGELYLDTPQSPAVCYWVEDTFARIEY